MPSNFDDYLRASPLAGFLGLSTASFYVLDPTGTVPIEPVADIVPAFTPFRVAVAMIDSENYVQNYRVTKNTLQDFTDTTPNVHRELVELTISGHFSSSPPMSLFGLPTAPTFGFRIDFLQMANLERMAAKRRPIAVITPRVSLAQAFIQSVQRPWQPADGESLPVVVRVIEARIASPFNVGVLPDTDGLAPGNSQTTGGGEQSVKPVDTPTPTQPAVAEVPPGVNPGLEPAA